LNVDEENEIEIAICCNEQWAQREANDPPILSFQREKTNKIFQATQDSTIN
jgi:hypothetical protein